MASAVRSSPADAVTESEVPVIATEAARASHGTVSSSRMPAFLMEAAPNLYQACQKLLQDHDAGRDITGAVRGVRLAQHQACTGKLDLEGPEVLRPTGFRARHARMPDRLVDEPGMPADLKVQVVKAWEQFLVGGCQAKDFTKEIHWTLVNRMGVGAHLDRQSFHETYFGEARGVPAFLDALEFGVHPFSDVGNAFLAKTREHGVRACPSF